MPPPAIVPVILGGGAGTRLWPLSRRERPKQLQPLLGGETLLQATALRAAQLVGAEPPVLVTGGGNAAMAVEQLEAVGTGPSLVMLEPVARNTAPAVAAAAVALEDRDPLLLVLPADHSIADSQAFAAAVGVAGELAAAGWLATFGVVPSRAETGYGYIERGEPCLGGWRVARFVEKPDASTAAAFLAAGTYRWNSGMFLFRTSVLLAELAVHAPAVLEAAQTAYRGGIADGAIADGATVRLGEAFAAAPVISLDHAVMERTSKAAVVSLDAGWSDIGSFEALWEAASRDERGNAVVGNVWLEGVTGSLVRSEDRLVAVVGLADVVVVDTPDALLVIDRHRSQEVKAVVERLVAADRPEL